MMTETVMDPTLKTRVDRVLNAVKWDHPDLVRTKLATSPAKLAALEKILLEEPRDARDGTTTSHTAGNG